MSRSLRRERNERERNERERNEFFDSSDNALARRQEEERKLRGRKEKLKGREWHKPLKGEETWSKPPTDHFSRAAKGLLSADERPIPPQAKLGDVYSVRLSDKMVGQKISEGSRDLLMLLWAVYRGKENGEIVAADFLRFSLNSRACAHTDLGFPMI